MVPLLRNAKRYLHGYKIPLLAKRLIDPLLGNVRAQQSELLRCRYNEYEKGLFARFAEVGDESVIRWPPRRKDVYRPLCTQCTVTIVIPAL
jgi:hypothetical protein